MESQNKSKWKQSFECFQYQGYNPDQQVFYRIRFPLIRKFYLLSMLYASLLVSILLIPVAETSLAQTKQTLQSGEEKTGNTVSEPKYFVTEHQGTFNGVKISYTATAGETFLLDEDEKPKAAIFTYAYIRNGVSDVRTRPVTFVWNGGPGSSSIWLHMGALGPKRVIVPSDAIDDGSPPYTLEDNLGTILDVTDLVFVDPVGTGYSRALGEHKNKEFWGMTADASSIAQFIRVWITRNRRWNSPKFLAGESFGTTRAAAVTARLERGRPTVSLNGLVLISQALDYTGSTPDHDNLIAYVTYLPTMAATAWYHKKVETTSSLEAFLDEARDFAVKEYAPALFQGSFLDEQTREQIARRLAYFTGLPKEYIERSDLRVLASRFRKELLGEQGLSVGRSDSRYIRDDVDDVADRPESDAASAGIGAAYTAAIYTYLADVLEVEMNILYKTSGGRELSANWSYRPVPEGSYWEPSYLNVTRDLSLALRGNRNLKILIASGYYDFATPFFDAEYTFARHGILSDRLTWKYYEAGHMMYVHHPSAYRFLQDIREFVVEMNSGK